MNQVSYRPAASPVDTFAPVGVSGTTDVRVGPDPLAQLGAALGRFSDSVAQAADGYTDRQKQAAGPEAARIQAENQFKNMDALREAVKSGKLNLTDNPWTKVHLEQLVAGEQTSGFLHELENTLNTDNSNEVAGVRNSGNPKVLSDWIDSKVGPYLAKQSHWGIAPATAATTQWKDNFIQRQIGEWGRQQEINTKRSFLSGLSAAAGPVALTFNQDSSLGRQLMANGGLTQLQNLVDSHIRVTGDEEGAGKALLATLHEIGASAHNSEFVQAAADNLKIGKKSLTAWATPEQIKELQDSVDSSTVADYERKRQLDRESGDTLYSTSIKPKILESLKKTGSILPALLETNTQIDQLPPEAAARVRGMRDQAIKTKVMLEVQSSVEQFGIGSNETTSLMSAFIANQAPGAQEAYETAIRLKNASQVRPAESDTGALVDLRAVINDPQQSSHNKLQALMQEAIDHRLSESDFVAVQHEFAAKEEPSPLPDHITAPAMRLAAMEIFDWTRQNDPTIRDEVARLRIGLGDESASAYLRDVQDRIMLGLEAQWNQLRIEKHNDVTYQDFKSLLQSSRPEGMKQKQDVQGPPTVEQSDPVQHFHQDAWAAVAAGEVQWGPNGFEVDGKYVSPPRNMYRNPDEVKANFVADLQAFKISAPVDVVRYANEMMDVAKGDARVRSAIGFQLGQFLKASQPKPAGGPTGVAARAGEDLYNKMKEKKP